jgi:hypothetical protein
MLKRKHIVVIGSAVFISIFCLIAPAFPEPKAAWPSLKDKSNEELLAFVVGHRQTAAGDCPQDQVHPSPLDRLWEMPPREAALTLASEYLEKEVKGRAKFLISENDNLKPPSQGEVGFRWISGNYYAPPERGMIVLLCDGRNSKILLSDFQILGPVPEEELKRAYSQTDEHPVQAAVAQQTFDILWWLTRVKRVGERIGGSSCSSTDEWGDFWIKPNGPSFNQVMLDSPNGEDLNDEQFSSLPAIAYQLVQRLIEREGIKPRRPLPTIGHHVDPNSDAEFLRLHPKPDSDDPAAVTRWAEQMSSILRNPARYEMYNDVLYALVPTPDPSRYKASTINRALFDLMRRGDDERAVHEKAAHEAEAEQQKLLSDLTQTGSGKTEEKHRVLTKLVVNEQSAALTVYLAQNTAGEMLGLRDVVAAFAELLDRAHRPRPKGENYGFTTSGYLTGAAAIVGNHPQMRGPLLAYVRKQLANIRQSQVSPEQLFDVVWRADLRELAPELQKLATASPDENEDPSISMRPAPTGNGKFHAARVILLAWREADRLTKTKLDAMLNGYVGRSNAIPEVLRSEFDALPPADQLTFRNFVTWMRSVEVPWSRRVLEDVFTPHTPRPDTPIER